MPLKVISTKIEPIIILIIVSLLLILIIFSIKRGKLDIPRKNVKLASCNKPIFLLVIIIFLLFN